MRIKDMLSCIATAMALSVAPYATAQFLTPGSNLVIDGVPPISTELVVVHVDDDYRGAALATPDRKLAWVSGREPTMEPARFDALVAKLAARGVDTSALQPVPQVAPATD